MATDDMKERLERVETRLTSVETKLTHVETRLDQLSTKVDALPTKADLSAFATRDDLVVFKDDIIKNFRLLSEDAKDSVRKAAEGYAATLEKIERELHDLNGKVDTTFADHAKILGNHNERISALEGP